MYSRNRANSYLAARYSWALKLVIVDYLVIVAYDVHLCVHRL